MPNFLFWNIGRKAICPLVAEVARCAEADFVVLCECTAAPHEVVDSLNQRAADYRYAFGECKSLMFFTKFEPSYLVPKFETPHISIRHLSLPARTDVLVVGAHLPSGLYNSRESLAHECQFLARYIDQEEQTVGHRRTILLGDLNVNPFESGVVGAGVFTRC
jgi:exonuclease III